MGWNGILATYCRSAFRTSEAAAASAARPTNLFCTTSTTSEVQPRSPLQPSAEVSPFLTSLLSHLATKSPESYRFQLKAEDVEEISGGSSGSEENLARPLSDLDHGDCDRFLRDMGDWETSVNLSIAYYLFTVNRNRVLGDPQGSPEDLEGSQKGLEFITRLVGHLGQSREKLSKEEVVSLMLLIYFRGQWADLELSKLVNTVGLAKVVSRLISVEEVSEVVHRHGNGVDDGRGEDLLRAIDGGPRDVNGQVDVLLHFRVPEVEQEGGVVEHGLALGLREKLLTWTSRPTEPLLVVIFMSISPSYSGVMMNEMSVPLPGFTETLCWTERRICISGAQVVHGRRLAAHWEEQVLPLLQQPWEGQY